MEVLKISLDDEEMAYVKEQPRGWMRSVVRRYIDHGHTALTPMELLYLRDHSGTKGVIAIARGDKSEPPQFDPETGEVYEEKI